MTRLLTLLLFALAVAACHKETVCPSGEVACGGKCVSPLTDAANCGACGHACGPLEACGAGTCGCAPGIATCGGACTDLARDAANCGACGAACGATQFCTTQATATSCTAACPGGFTACGQACVELATDVRNCGACGHACAAGETCRSGTCGAELQVACYATGDVRPVTADLQPAGAPRDARGSPTVLAAAGGALYTGNGFPAGVAVIPLDASLPTRLAVLPGNDIEGVTPYAGAVLVSNAEIGTLVILGAAGDVLDEIVLPGDAPNPHGAAVAGSMAYIALYGNGPDATHPIATGQKIAKVDLSALPACAADATPPACGAGGACAAGRECRDGLCRLRCGTVAGTIDLQVAGAADANGFPFPGKVAVRDGKVYVALANLKLGDCGGGFQGYCQPAGDGKLAVIDTAAGDALSILDLGAGCQNAGDVVVKDTAVWVTCGSFTFRATAPGAVVAVDVSGTPRLDGSPVDASAIVPGNLAFCGGLGYVTDQASGAVLRFDPAARHADAPVTVCPTVYFAYASDVACP